MAIVQSDIILADGALLNIESGETVYNAIVNSGGSMYVSSGGTATNTIENGGYVYVEDGADISFVPNAINGLVLSNSATVHSGTTANSATVNSGGSMFVSSGGTANSTTVNGNGRVTLKDGGTLNDIAISFGIVSVSGGTVNGASVDLGGKIIIQSGATATEIIENGGYVEIEDGANVTFTPNIISGNYFYDTINGGTTVHSGTVLDNIVTIRSPDIIVFNGGSVSNIFGGDIQIFDGGSVSNTLISGHIRVSSGGRLTGRIAGQGGNVVIVSSGGIIDFDLTQTSPCAQAKILNLAGTISGTPTYTVTVNADQTEGIYTLAEKATEFEQTISVVNTTGSELGTLMVGETTDISGVDYTLSLSEEGVLSLKVGNLLTPSPYSSEGLTVSKAATVESGDVFHNTWIVSSGSLAVSSGGSVESTMICPYEKNHNISGGDLIISGGGSASSTTVNGGRMVVSSGGSADFTNINICGTIRICSGGTATKIKENGGVVSVEDGATVSFEANTLSNLDLGAATLHSGTTAFNIQIERSLTVFDGGEANNTTLLYGNLDINSGGITNYTTVSNGYLRISSGGIANYTSLSRGYLYVSNGGTANNTTVNDGRMIIFSGGTATATYNGGYITVSSGGTATIVFTNPAIQNITAAKGATVICEYDARVYYLGRGNEIISKTDTIDALEIGSRFSAYVCPGGTANDTTVSSMGMLCVLCGGMATNTTIYSEGIMRLFSDGTAGNTMVNSGGSLFVSSRGKATGKVLFEEGAVVSVYEGGIVDFDLTQAGETALVNDLSIIQGTPLYTLTVNDDLKPGNYVYSLADGAAEFASTISVVNTSGDELGTFTIGETVKIGYDDYTLNLNEGALSVTVESPDLTPQTPVGTVEKVSWEETEAEAYVVEYSTDNFEHVIRVVTAGNAVDTPDLPAGTYHWRVKADTNSEWAVGEAITVDPEADATPKVVQSNEDGNDDMFFASTNGTWENIYYAQHVGSINDWAGTNEIVSASGKGRIHNLFFGSADPNVLCLTDGENGDAIFVDDVYTDLPESVAEHTARLYRIKEIRAGAGNDIVDMTSQQFEYVGDGLTIRGGTGNDIIWANKGDNWLFGDAGNDRIVGASGNDVIAGGIGNDRMHGGGGSDVFTFCDNWGADNVEQLESGTVTLWFVEGSIDNWDTETLTYADGENSVKVSGVSAEQITLKFGENSPEDAAQFASLTGAGAFDAFTSQGIFEESGKGILANL